MGTGAQDYSAQFTATELTTGAMYCAMLVKIDSAKTGGDYFFHTYKTGGSTNFYNRIYVKKASNGNLSFGLLKGATALNIVWSDSSYLFSDTHLLVLKVEIVSGIANDIPSLFIDPVVSATEPTIPTITATDIASTDYTGIDRIALRQGSASVIPKLTVDEIRVGTSWADVVTETVSAVDVSSVAVLAPSNSACGATSDTVKVKVKNLATANASAIPVYASITKPDNSTSVVNTTLAVLNAGDSAIVSLAPVNTTMSGTYHIKAWTALSGDQDLLNDTVLDYSFTVASFLSTPFIDDFESAMPYWQLSNMAVVAAGTHGNSSAALSFLLDGTHTSASATIAERITPINQHTHVLMNYRIVDAATYQGVALQTGDSLFLEVSTDCQSTFTRVASINSSNHNTNTNYNRFISPLASFAGQNIIFRISGTQTVGTYLVDIDSLEIRDADLCNMGVVSKVAPVSKSCGVANDPITAIFKNLGDAPVQNIPVSVQFFRPYNPPLVTFNDTITSVVLPGAQITFTFDSIINTTISGKYTMLITASLPGDTVMTLGHTANNTFIDSVFTHSPLPVPYQEGFATISYLSDYTTSFAYDATNAYLYQNINTGFVSSSIDLIHKVGPLSATHSLFFKYKFTDQSENAMAMGNDDSLAVYISTDCGTTFTPLYTITNANHTTSNQWATKQLPLSAYSGQSVLVSMVLKGTTNNSRFSIDNIVIDGAPVISISPDTLYKCSGQTATINPTGSALYQYEWVEKSAPATVIAITQQLQVTTTGYYKVKATNGVGFITYDSIYVYFRSLPNVTLTFGNTISSLCPNASTVNLSGQSPVGATGVFSGTGVTSNQFNPQTAGVGSHLITYTYTDSYSCVNSVVDTIVVTPATTVALSGIPDLCLNGQPHTLIEGTPTNGVYSGAGVSSGVFNPAVATVGNHIITYTFTDAHNCQFMTTDTVTVKVLPNAYAGNDVSICAGDSVTLNASGGVTYLWNTNANTTSIRVSPAADFQYIVTASGANGCLDSDTVKVTVKPIPVVLLALLDTVCLQQGLVQLTGGSATPLGGTGAYSGAGVSNNSFNPVVGLGSHIIRYTYTLNGCSAYAEDSIFVENCTGVDEYSRQVNLAVMPNPAESSVVITADLKDNTATLAIYDIAGKLIQSQNIKTINGKLLVTIDLHDLTSGVYVVKVSSRDGVSMVKLIKR